MRARPSPLAAAIQSLRHALTIAEALCDTEPVEARRILVTAAREAIRVLVKK
jgi:hypothetical protein